MELTLPDRIKRLHVDARGYPVPWFVDWVQGKPDFRIIDGRKKRRAVKENRCFICREPLGKQLAFVIGPMCAVNRVSSEPPSHRDCAEYAAAVCPFLTRPHMHRREGGIPAEATDAPGISLAHNPGVTLIWITRSYGIIPVRDGWLLSLGDPEELLWRAHGRDATRQEILDAIHKGLPHLRRVAEFEGALAVRKLDESVERAMKLIPRDVA
jgi:hypothetical protein